MSADEDNNWLTVRDVAEMFQCSEDIVYRAIRDGKLEASYLGKKTIRIHRNDALAWAKE